jgi:hypothetical protein
MPPVVVSSEEVDRTITAFTRLDQRGDKKAMNKLAGRLQREQPHLLQYAAAIRNDHGDKAGEGRGVLRDPGVGDVRPRARGARCRA